LQQILMTGYLGRDVEMRYTPQGTAVADFSLGVTVGWGDNKHTQWWKVTCWRGLAETVSQYLHKGSWVQVIGEVQDDDGNPRVWTGKDGVAHASFECTAKEIDFGPRQSSDAFEPNDPAPEIEAQEIPF